jgi:hypothetical protein
MLSERRKSELAGLSRHEWEWEQSAPERARADAELCAHAREPREIDPAFLPDHCRVEDSLKKRDFLAQQLRAAFAHLPPKTYCTRLAPWLLILHEKGCISNATIFSRWRISENRIDRADSPQIFALNHFLAAGFDWVIF